MARVTKINVGGTNYDIAHEGVLKNSGFEVVTSLPTTGLFEGRQVFYQGIKYVYNQGWRSQYNPTNFPNGVTLRSSTEALTNAATVIELSNFELSQIPELLNKSLFISNNENAVKKSDRLYEMIDNETGAITVLSDIVQPVLGQTLRYTAINPSGSIRNLYDHLVKNGTIYAAYCVYIPQNIRREKAVYKIEYYIYTNATGNGDYNNKDNYEWKTVFEKELNQYSEVIYPFPGTNYTPYTSTYTYIFNVRVSITPTTKRNKYDISISDIDILYYGLFHKSPAYANRLINFDANIEPTQTSTEFKSPLWLWQYLTQGINWLKANDVRLSAYNTKVAALEQADSDNNASIQSVRTDLTELSNGLATVARSGKYDDLIGKPTLFSGSYNDLTDKPTLFSGSYEDLTDKPTLASVATSGSYNDLTDKPTFSGSYNDLTDKPTLATVATSGNYNDLLNKPDLVFSNIGGNVATAQITDGSITNTKLANSSMTLNGISCELGGTKTLPCIISFNGTLYKVRIYQNWLQIYHAGMWVNKYYLLSNPPTECRYITDLSDPSWYDESVTEYELDNSATEQLLRADSSDNIANWIEAIGANQITFNSSVIPSKVFNKGALNNIISNLKGKGYSVFVENDIDTILNSGNDWVISIKIKRFNNLYKAIIECYVAR